MLMTRRKWTGLWVSTAIGAAGWVGCAAAEEGSVLTRRIESLKNKNAEIRADNAKALGEMGAEAMPAIPPLLDLLKDGEEKVRDCAAGAIKQIAGTKVEKTTTTDSGLQFVDLKAGEGSAATAGQAVTVHYTGWLTNGKKFDSSRDRKDPFEFQLGAKMVIAGWDEGVAGLKPGSRRLLIIPAKLAYGNRDVGNGLIPAGSTLIFDVELLSSR